MDVSAELYERGTSPIGGCVPDAAGLRGEAVPRRTVLSRSPKRHFAPSRRRVKACDMSNDSTRQHLIGTWKLIAAVREEISSGTKTEFLGPNPVGYINYGADGRMLVLTVGSGRRKPAGPKATSAEVEALFRSMTSYKSFVSS